MTGSAPKVVNVSGFNYDEGMAEKDEIIHKLKKNVPGIFQKYNLDFLILFGSTARGKIRSRSDIDIGFRGQLDFDQELELAGDLSRILKSNYVDLVNLGRVSPLLGHLASRQAILIYEKEKGQFADFRTCAFKKFVETKPLRRLNFRRTIDYVRQYSSLSL